MTLKGSHIISVDQFTHSDLELIFSVTREMEIYAHRKKTTKVLEGALLGNLFFEPSTRTRISFDAAFSRLGGNVCDTTEGFKFSSMAKGESLYDTSRVVSGYVDVIVIRHPIEGSVKTFAEATNIPVINGGDGPGEHPTQALLDLYTIQKELDKNLVQLKGLKIAMVGDLKYGRTVHSLTKLLCLLEDINFVFVSPPELKMPTGILATVKANQNSVFETNKLVEGITNVDVVYMTRVQQERFTTAEEARKYAGLFSINHHIYNTYCKPGTILMHPLPRDSQPGANELDADLNQNPKLAIFRQADNGIPVRMALFAILLGVENEVHKTARNVQWFVPSMIGN